MTVHRKVLQESAPCGRVQTILRYAVKQNLRQQSGLNLRLNAGEHLCHFFFVAGCIGIDPCDRLQLVAFLSFLAAGSGHRLAVRLHRGCQVLYRPADPLHEVSGQQEEDSKDYDQHRDQVGHSGEKDGTNCCGACSGTRFGREPACPRPASPFAACTGRTAGFRQAGGLYTACQRRKTADGVRGTCQNGIIGCDAAGF